MRLHSKSNKWIGVSVNNIILGEPTQDDAGVFIWEDSSLPEGTIDKSGKIIVVNEDGQEVILAEIVDGIAVIS